MEFDKAVAELDALVATLEREGDERSLLLLELIDAVHRPGLEAISRGEPDHPIARALLAMYELAEVEPEVLVEEALDDVRPYIESHGGAVELLTVSDGVVEVRMSGACHGCAASAVTLRRGIEEAIRSRYPQLREVIAHEPEGAPAPELLQIEGVERLRGPRFVDVAAIPPYGELAATTVEGVAVLLANVAGELYAFRNECPVDGRPLDGGRLTGTVLVCPWHNCAYDARSGKRVDGVSEQGLAVVPVAPAERGARVAVNVL